MHFSKARMTVHTVHQHLHVLKVRSSPCSSPSAGEHSLVNTHSFALAKTVSSNSDPELQRARSAMGPAPWPGITAVPALGQRTSINIFFLLCCSLLGPTLLSVCRTEARIKLTSPMTLSCLSSPVLLDEPGSNLPG